jgi:acyl carrier protein
MQEKMLQPQQSPSYQLSSAEDIQDWLALQVAEQLGIDPDEINLRVPFNSFGLDSVQIMAIANLGKQHFGLQLSPLVIWNYPNIETLSQYLAEELRDSEREVLEL